jgi:hypothetical protein
MTRTIAALGPLLLALGCNNPNKPPDVPVDAASAEDMVSPADLRGPVNDLAGPGDLASAYPPGPYGFEVGSVVAPLVWEGYANPTAEGPATDKPYGRYTLDEIRRSGARYLLLYTADEF